MIQNLRENLLTLIWFTVVAIGAGQIQSCSFNDNLERIHHEASTQRTAMVDHVDLKTDDTNKTVHAHDSNLARIESKLDQCLENWRQVNGRKLQPTTRP